MIFSFCFKITLKRMSQRWLAENVKQQIIFAFLESKSANKFEKSNNLS
jgi:hypothetical protein